MRNLKFIELYRLTAFLIILVILSSSCKKDDEETPDYLGKWMTAKPIAGSTGFVLVNYSLTLIDHTFTETFLTGIYRATPTYPGTFVTMEGSVSVSGKTMKLIVHKLSYSNYNSSTATASEPYETNTFEDKDFGFVFEGIGMSTSNHHVEYGIVDNQLILKVDYNMDGIYSENEKSVYTK